MKESATALGEFLNDFIGRVVPGSVLLSMLALIFEWPVEADAEFLSSFSFMLLFVSVSYGVGHAIAGLHAFFRPALAVVNLALDEEQVFAKLAADGQMARARRCVTEDASVTGRTLRSMLMTLSPQSRELAVRFQHVSLLYACVGTAILTATFARIYAVLFSPAALRIIPVSLDLWVQSAVALLVAIASFRAGSEFHRRSLTTPFSAGVAEISRSASPGV